MQTTAFIEMDRTFNQSPIKRRMLWKMYVFDILKWLQLLYRIWLG